MEASGLSTFHLSLSLSPSFSFSHLSFICALSIQKLLITDFLKSSFSLTVLEDDIVVRRFKDLKKRKRDDPVAHGALFIRDLGFLSKFSRSEILHGIDGEDDVKELEKEFLDRRRSVVGKTDGIELNLEGVKFRLTASVPESDDFGMRKEWEELNAFGNRGYSRGGRQQQPDTIVLKGVPSHWFAEPRVSSKPSMLVTHTIFSAFGKIRFLALKNLATGFLQQGPAHYDRALRCYLQAVEIDTKDSVVWNQR